MYQNATTGGPSHAEKKIGEDWTCSSGDMLANRQIHTNEPTRYSAFYTFCLQMCK